MALDLSSLPNAASLLSQSAPGPESSGLMETLIQTIQSAGDPLAQQMIKGLLEEDLGIKIPSREEIMLQEIQQRQILRQAQKADDIARVEHVINTALSQGARDDFMDDPDRFIQVNQELARAGLVDYVLDRGQLRSGGLQSAQTSAEKREAERLARQTQAIDNATELAEQVQDEDGFLQQSLEAAISGVSEQAEARTGSGMDLGPGFGTDIDEEGGAQALLSVYDVFQSGVAGTADRSVAADAFLARYGEEIVDQLSGLNADEEGRFIVGSGDLGVDDTATTFLTVLLSNVARDMGRSVEDLFSELGLEYTGVNPESFQAALGQALESGSLTVSSPGARSLGF